MLTLDNSGGVCLILLATDVFTVNTDVFHVFFFRLIRVIETTEEFLPSAKETLEKGHRCPFNPTAQTARNVGTVIQCQDCGKWRCLHSNRKLKQAERDELSVILDTVLYSCGSTLDDLKPEEGSDETVLNVVFVRANFCCRSAIEYTYYSAGYEPICIYCASEAPQIREGYYPQCEDCSGEKAISKRGFKKVKEKWI